MKISPLGGILSVGDTHAEKSLAPNRPPVPHRHWPAAGARRGEATGSAAPIHRKHHDLPRVKPGRSDRDQRWAQSRELFTELPFSGRASTGSNNQPR